MKCSVLLVLLFTTQVAWSKACEVYGITDSPQKLDCRFKSQTVALRCVNGTYFLNKDRVDNAFHMDVEEGASPLVFKSSPLQLTVVIETPTHILGELEQGSKYETGRCQF